MAAPKLNPDAQPPLCEPSILRNRYFRGKYMNAEAFDVEQAYVLDRLRLRGRLCGWGVVRGLEVVPHDIPECIDRWVTVRCGLAIDPYGREILLGEDRHVALETEVQTDAGGDEQVVPRGGTFFLCLRHCEEGAHPVRVLDSEAAAGPNQTAFDHVKEVAVIEILDEGELPPGMWRRVGGDPDDVCSGAAEIDPSSSTSETLVPLAILKVDPSKENEEAVAIEMRGRRQLAINGEHLTHVSHTNWLHGERLSLACLAAEDHELRIGFDQPLAEDSGLDGRSFTVTWEDDEGLVRRLPSEPGNPRLEDNRRRAAFRIDPALLDPAATLCLIGRVLTVVLNCDVVRDRNGNPLDGSHLDGRLPSGDGVAGGRFESWLVLSEEYAQDNDGQGEP